MSILSTPSRSAAALLGACAAFAFAAGPADAAKARHAKPKAKADLTVRNLHIDVSDEGTLLVSGNLLNIGRKFARPSSVVIALSDDDVLDDSDDVLDEVDYLRVGAGVRRAVDDEVDIPLDVDTSDDGELNILVCADGNDDIIEKSETNNCVSQSVVLDDVAPVDDGSGSDDPSSDDGGDQTDPGAAADDGSDI